MDHFVAWSRYPVDLAHNFVLADGRCNGQKRDRLPACEHLAAWTERNVKYGEELGAELARRGVVAELGSIEPRGAVGIRFNRSRERPNLGSRG